MLDTSWRHLTLVLTLQQCVQHTWNVCLCFTAVISVIIYLLTRVEQCLVSQEKDKDTLILQAGMQCWEKCKHFGGFACRIRSIIHKLCEVKSLFCFILVRNILWCRKFSYAKLFLSLYVCTHTCEQWILCIHTMRERRVYLSHKRLCQISFNDTIFINSIYCLR